MVPARIADTGASPRATILVVEDEPLVRMMLVDVLYEAGFKAIEAAHADEALKVLDAVPEIRAVITDVEMPAGSMNGFGLARLVRAQWRIAVLILSGQEVPGPDGLAPGVDFLRKPVGPDSIVPRLERLLGS